MSVADFFQFTQPVIDQYLQVLQAGIDDAITEYNATARGTAYPLDPISQWKDYLPPPSILMGGCPVIGIGEGGGPSRLTDDLVFEAKGTHPLLFNVYVQSSDSAMLVHQLRGYLVVIANLINADRLLGQNAVLARPPAQAWVTRWRGAQPGAALDLVNPDAPEESPRSWLSWAGILIEVDRMEIAPYVIGPAPPSGGALLTESGGRLLTEAGGALLLET